ncbi:hypothetical protein CI102_10213 [Trichoderma harzianum]|uniref:Uncharacterized protein n=1 Tax=Trichoderma harzianum CBS 226.95 TaxID=983964 RepID=A0A2T4AL79_TRIHA|nr:hypothetical protein M431DRAFT_350923 [Trichoderma harzianum CBS 226.95]PKK46214.1 hypothetical protein CI102_10213 [Trichoderma harzianum]PTB57826.1 hypothetical protein M431DRAFT_350923 [Trichoderma harzianum CBS 226.95]
MNVSVQHCSSQLCLYTINSLYISTFVTCLEFIHPSLLKHADEETSGLRVNPFFKTGSVHFTP